MYLSSSFLCVKFKTWSKTNCPICHLVVIIDRWSSLNLTSKRVPVVSLPTLASLPLLLIIVSSFGRPFLSRFRFFDTLLQTLLQFSIFVLWVPWSALFLVLSFWETLLGEFKLLGRTWESWQGNGIWVFFLVSSFFIHDKKKKKSFFIFSPGYFAYAYFWGIRELWW